MGHSQASKVHNHERILRIAARMFREKGLEGLSIATLMQKSGLTHGGFYKHFTSRDDLLTQALKIAFAEPDDPEKYVKYLATIEPGEITFDMFVRAYLGKIHRDDPSSACAVGTLVSDVGRAGKDVKDLYTARVKKNLEGLIALMSGPRGKRDKSAALVVFSALVGAFALARAISDRTLSDDLLKAVQDFVLTGFSPARHKRTKRTPRAVRSSQGGSLSRKA
jgi:TetR/AcrR family transcriptional regulator, transcriptional repressor for nem operon